MRALAILFVMWPAALAAHPHIFIETALKLVVSDTGVLEAVEVEWVYDELYSLLILEEKGLDPDFDGVLSADELAILAGWDLNWVPEYDGDLYVTRGDEAIPLGDPVGLGVEMRAGQIVTHHRRAVNVPADGALVQAYDPTFYTAYDLAGRVSIAGVCRVEVIPANLDRAYAALEELLFATPQRNVDENFPEVGQTFADQVWVTCD